MLKSYVIYLCNSSLSSEGNVFISHPTFDRDAELRDQRENGSHRIGLKLYKKGFKCH